MENALLLDFRIFNYLCNSTEAQAKKVKELKKKRIDDYCEPSYPAIRYPKTSKIETFKNSIKFKEEDSPLYVNYRKSDSLRQKHKRRVRFNSGEIQHVNVVNNIMF